MKKSDPLRISRGWCSDCEPRKSITGRCDMSLEVRLIGGGVVRCTCIMQLVCNGSVGEDMHACVYWLNIELRFKIVHTETV